MIIAIPLFDQRVSPRFDSAQAFLQVKVISEIIVERQEILTKNWTSIARVRQLCELGVDILICGGIDRYSKEYLSSNNITIYSWVTGWVEDVLFCFLKGELKDGIMLGPGGRRRGHWKFRKKRGHRGGGKGGGRGQGGGVAEALSAE